MNETIDSDRIINLMIPHAALVAWANELMRVRVGLMSQLNPCVEDTKTISTIGCQMFEIEVALTELK